MSLITNSPSGPDYNQNETPEDKPDGGLWWQRKHNAMAGSNGVVWGGEYGWADGGAGYAPSGASTQKFAFTTESAAQLVSTAQYSGANLDYSSAGFILGAGGYLSAIQKLVYANEEVVTITSTLSQARTQAASLQQEDIGYAEGGYSASGVQSVNVDKLVFATETQSTLSNSPDRRGGAMGTQSSDAGYSFGGNYQVTPPTVVETYIQTRKMLFTTEVVASLGSLPESLAGGATVQTDTNGYVLGGRHRQGSPYTQYYRTTCYRFVFSTEAFAALSSSLTYGGRDGGAGVQSRIKGYDIGGYSTVGASTTTVEAMVFSSEAITMLSTALQVAHGQYGGLSRTS